MWTTIFEVDPQRLIDRDENVRKLSTLTVCCALSPEAASFKSLHMYLTSVSSTEACPKVAHSIQSHSNVCGSQHIRLTACHWSEEN